MSEETLKKIHFTCPFEQLHKRMQWKTKSGFLFTGKTHKKAKEKSKRKKRFCKKLI